MRRLIVVLLTVVAGLASWRALTIADPVAPATFEAGENAYVALHFDQARKIYAAAAVSSTQPPKDRAAAWRQLGVMAWRLKGDASEAETDFGQALAVGADLSATHAERARFYMSVRRFDDGIKAADAAMGSAKTAADRKAGSLAVAKAILAKLDGVAIAQQTDADIGALAHARDVMHPLSEAPPLPLDHSEALLKIALRLDDGALALVAWNSDAREGADVGAWAPAARRLTAALPIRRKGNMAPGLRNEIFEGLRTSQFFELAALVASDGRLADAATFVQTPRVADVAAYAQALRETARATDAYYRDLANGKGDRSAWRKSLSASGEKLWGRLTFAGTRPPYSDSALGADLRTRFGAYVNMGDTGGVEDLHYGHVFIDDPRAVEQYGHKASIRRVALDRIISNGYESWVWDDRQAHGGWATDDAVVQVRPGYADGAMRIWDRITDPAQRAEVEQKIAALSAGDDALAAREPGVFLPGLTVRLEWEGENAIVDRLKARGVAGNELKRMFLVEQSRIKLESNFYAHEGRHVLDKIAFDDTPQKLESEELEFRAKLSEVAFSEEPRICFGSIFNPNIADATSPHGRANKRIAAGLVHWMEAHRSAIAGLDAARPLLPQFDKLTNDQMRDAMRAMDPWAPKA